MQRAHAWLWAAPPSLKPWLGWRRELARDGAIRSREAAAAAAAAAGAANDCLNEYSGMPLFLVQPTPSSSSSSLANLRAAGLCPSASRRFSARQESAGGIAGPARSRRRWPGGTRLVPAAAASFSACSFNSAMKLPMLDASGLDEKRWAKIAKAC